MAATPLIDPALCEIKLAGYSVASANGLRDPSILPRVQEYRRLTASRMQPLERSELRSRIPTTDYHVSRKLDGEFTALVFREGEVFSVNPGGTVRLGLPWQREATQLLLQSGIREAIFAGELYVAPTDSQRTRIHDVVTAVRNPQAVEELQQLRFAVFDILSLDQQPVTGPFFETWQNILRLFGKGNAIHPVEAIFLNDVASLDHQFSEWVERQGAEGLVIRSNTAGIFKVKPRHSLDAVVIGFTESTGDRQGMLHDLLLAVARADGTLQVLSRVGGGFTDDARREMLSDLKDLVVDSEYVEVNSDHVAYQMVEPRWVIEISCLDLVSQSSRGGPIQRAVLDFDAQAGRSYRVLRRMPLASVISPQFVRRRDDKSPTTSDIRVAQISDRVEVPQVDRQARLMTQPKSEILRRETYTKELKGQTMVRKFLLWQTNKAVDDQDFPAYVLHYTDFSPNRKTPLDREMRVSSSLDQMLLLWDQMQTEYIKQGWGLRKAWRAAAIAPPQALEISSAIESVAETEPIEMKLAASEKSVRKRTTKKKSG